MKYFMILLLVVSGTCKLSAQNQGADMQDSLQQAMQKHWELHHERLRIYDKMFTEDPKAAIDSAVLAENEQIYSLPESIGQLAKLDQLYVCTPQPAECFAKVYQ